jgi:hypothetical protein
MDKKVKKYAKAGYVDYAGSNQDLSLGTSSYSPTASSRYGVKPKIVGGMPGIRYRTPFAKGGKLTDLTGDGKVTRADVLKGRGVPGFAKGGSASKRADGCATKGKTKGKMV